MKKINFLLSLLLPLSLFAQLRQGAIVYERKADLRRHVEDEQMRAMVPPFQKGNYQLLFNDSLSVYKSVPAEEGPDPFENNGPAGSGGMRMSIKFAGPGEDGVLFENFAGGRLLEEAVLEDKKYIITDSIARQSWKLSDDTASVLGHVCKKATATNPRGQAIIAWYATDIPLPIGPAQFGGLPGAILKLDVGNADFTFQATDIRAVVSAKDLKAPTSGKLITRSDYMKKMDEVMGSADAQGRRIRRN